MACAMCFSVEVCGVPMAVSTEQRCGWTTEALSVSDRFVSAFFHCVQRIRKFGLLRPCNEPAYLTRSCRLHCRHLTRCVYVYTTYQVSDIENAETNGCDMRGKHHHFPSTSLFSPNFTSTSFWKDSFVEGALGVAFRRT